MVDRTLEYELNQLIRLMHDSVDGYKRAAELVDSDTYRALFTRLGVRRKEFVDELTALEIVVGGSPTDEGSIGAALYRTIKEISLALSGDKDLVILNAVRDVLADTIGKYESILSDDFTIVKTAREIIENQHQSLLNTQTEIAELIRQHKK